MTMVISPRHLYKLETGSCPVDEIEYEFEIWRSKGQWIINITNEEKFHIWGNRGVFEITKLDEDYVQWLEEKVMERTNKRLKIPGMRKLPSPPCSGATPPVSVSLIVTRFKGASITLMVV